MTSRVEAKYSIRRFASSRGLSPIVPHNELTASPRSSVESGHRHFLASADNASACIGDNSTVTVIVCLPLKRAARPRVAKRHGVPPRLTAAGKRAAQIGLGFSIFFDGSASGSFATATQRGYSATSRAPGSNSIQGRRCARGNGSAAPWCRSGTAGKPV
jgi:hypothetical protein